MKGTTIFTAFAGACVILVVFGYLAFTDSTDVLANRDTYQIATAVANLYKTSSGLSNMKAFDTLVKKCTNDSSAPQWDLVSDFDVLQKAGLAKDGKINVEVCQVVSKMLVGKGVEVRFADPVTGYIPKNPEQLTLLDDSRAPSNVVAGVTRALYLMKVTAPTPPEGGKRVMEFLAFCAETGDQKDVFTVFGLTKTVDVCRVARNSVNDLGYAVTLKSPLKA